MTNSVDAAFPHSAAFGRHPLPQAGEGSDRAESLFSRLREKVAAP